MELEPSMDIAISPCNNLHCSGLEVPCTVVVERVVCSMSDSSIFSLSTIIGSAIDILAWSSIIARPSIVSSVLGYVSRIGHVLLYEDAQKTLP